MCIIRNVPCQLLSQGSLNWQIWKAESWAQSRFVYPSWFSVHYGAELSLSLSRLLLVFSFSHSSHPKFSSSHFFTLLGIKNRHVLVEIISILLPISLNTRIFACNFVTYTNFSKTISPNNAFFYVIFSNICLLCPVLKMHLCTHNLPRESCLFVELDILPFHQIMF